jgi:hypothetical protein
MLSYMGLKGTDAKEPQLEGGKNHFYKRYSIISQPLMSLLY